MKQPPEPPNEPNSGRPRAAGYLPQFALIAAILVLIVIAAYSR